MDPLTQGILGAAMGHVVAGRQLGKAAMALGFIGGVVPDLDIYLVSDESSIDYWRYHRGITHSLFFGPVIGAVLALICRSIWRWRDWTQISLTRWYVLWVAALITHPLLDAITHWGTKLLTPLTEARFGISALAVIDPIYTVILAIGLIWAIFAGARTPRARSVVTAALLISTAYIGFGWLQNIRAEQIARADLERQNLPHTEVVAYTTMFLPWLRRCVATNGKGHWVGFVSTLSPQPIRWQKVESDPDAQPLIAQFADHEEGEIYLAFANGPMKTIVINNGDGERELRMDDMRYGFVDNTISGLWGLSVVFKSDGAIRRIARYSMRPDTSSENIWALMRAHLGLPQELF
jgi:inner membrane protein